MITYLQAQPSVRKTFNISGENADRMQKFLSPRKQTEFVNQALEHAFSKMEKEQKLKSISAKIRNIKRVKSTEPVVETLRKLREERSSRLADSSIS